ncbi:T9SS type A sorting domain-containing protein, partial [bacterium]|nr:T9SS type A sorting domain-containing protein [bacterium]
SGTVYQPDGSVAGGAVVEPLAVPVPAVTADGNGAYSIDLPAGMVYDMQAELAGVGRVIEPVDLQGDQVHDFTLLPFGAHVDIDPESFDETLLVGEASTHSLTVVNMGADPLNWRLAAEEIGGAPRPAVPTYGPATVAKGEDDPRPGMAPAKGEGGPDAFGYVWVDSNEPGGPSYDWFDISELGTTVGNSDDESYGPFDMGCAIPYYGSSYSQIRICTNGFVTFSSSNADPYSNNPMPNTADPDLMIAPFWDDLNPSQGGEIYRYYDAPNQRYIVQWDGVPHYYSDGSFTFQVQLYASGAIIFQYNSISYGDECTVGIENEDASDGLQVVYNSNYLENEMAILVSAGSLVPWLSYEPFAGTIGAGETRDVSVIFNAEGIEPGDYLADMMLHSNDTENPTLTLPVTLTVTDDVTDAGELPLSFKLENPAPNPFNPSTTLSFSLPQAGHTELKLYDVQGRLVRTLVDEQMTAGQHQVRWQGRDDGGRQVASGTYLARLISDGQISVRTLVLVK